MKLLNDLKISTIENLISLAIFGSYRTKYFVKNKSDIDILVLMDYRDDITDEFELEDKLIPILRKYFNYDDIHLTFISMRDYDTIFARQYIDSDDRLVINKYKEIDFRLYVNKYLRENDWIIQKIKCDTKLMEEDK